MFGPLELPHAQRSEPRLVKKGAFNPDIVVTFIGKGPQLANLQVGCMAAPTRTALLK